MARGLGGLSWHDTKKSIVQHLRRDRSCRLLCHCMKQNMKRLLIYEMLRLEFGPQLVRRMSTSKSTKPSVRSLEVNQPVAWGMKRSGMWKLRDPLRAISRDDRRFRQRSSALLQERVTGGRKPSSTTTSSSRSSPRETSRFVETTEGSRKPPKSNMSPPRRNRSSFACGSASPSGGRWRSLMRRLALFRGRRARQDTGETTDAAAVQYPVSDSQSRDSATQQERQCPAMPTIEEEGLILEGVGESVAATSQGSLPSLDMSACCKQSGDPNDVEAARQDSPIEKEKESRQFLPKQARVARIAFVGIFLNGIAVALASFAPGRGEAAKELVKETILGPSKPVLPGSIYASRGTSLVVYMVVDPRNRVYACVAARDVPAQVAFSMLEEVQIDYLTKVANLRFTSRENAHGRRCKQQLKKTWVKYERIERALVHEKKFCEVLDKDTWSAHGKVIECIALEFKESGIATRVGPELLSRNAVATVAREVFAPRRDSPRARRRRYWFHRFLRAALRLGASMVALFFLVRFLM